MSRILGSLGLFPGDTYDITLSYKSFSLATKIFLKVDT